LPFDGHDVVETALTGDVLGGLPLRVRGVEGDYHRPALRVRDVLEKLPDLGGLVRAVGHLDLGYGHGLAVGHRREQGHLAVGVGPGSAQDLAVHGDGQQAVGAALGPLGQPRPDQPVQLARVDVPQDPPQRRLARAVEPAPEPVPARAQLGQQRLRKVRGLRADLPVVRGTGQRGDHRAGEHEYQLMPPALRAARVSQPPQHLQQSHTVTLAFGSGRVRQVIRGM